jgi:hypothetical protein
LPEEINELAKRLYESWRALPRLCRNWHLGASHCEEAAGDKAIQ